MSAPDERITTRRSAGGYITSFCECGWGSESYRTSMAWNGSTAQRRLQGEVEDHLDECELSEVEA